MTTPELEGRVVAITGAARGMGRAYVDGFLATGARVVATDRSWSGVGDFRSALAANEDALALDMDVTSDAAIDRAHDAALAEFGTIDVLINKRRAPSDAAGQPDRTRDHPGNNR